jgi:hypothetical protein
MSTLGFIAIIIGCITWLITVFRFSKTGITIHRTSEDVTKRPPIATDAVAPEPTATTEETPQNQIAKVSLDAVIQAANEIMGVNVITQEDANG